ncbi:amidohydrolase family protein [Microvirga sp. VF16]|uniref:amidohydrolase family protein n=1 Tax=Microvirga sp. VF16 TaxID=2807101 RepID=UPI00193D880E|nr:amidohydrolase family protein [Microvirga sp. VF16]QRM34161.1 amidohydrolase [Microvirga sp. VF16]
MSTFSARIDVHHHLIPPDFVAAMAARGLTEVAGSPLPVSWTPEASIEIMDANDIATAIVSVPAPVYFGDRSEARDLARTCNESAAELVVRHPGRFGWFAVLPMPFTEDACREAVHALDVLRADGVILLGSTEGKFLGDPVFDELMAELDQRATVVFLHPNLHKTSTELGLAGPGSLIEFLCDTTRAATNLILSGTMEKYVRIRWILAHAGGFLPYVAWRLSLVDALPEYGLGLPQSMLTYIRRFYYETALSPSPYAMAALRELVDPDQIVFGSDYPFAPPSLVSLEIATFEGLNVFSEATKRGVDRAHALALFPKFASADYSDDQVRPAAEMSQPVE